MARMSNNGKRLEELQQRSGYTFTNPALLSEAMTHASYANSRQESNERLEFLGDSVLGLVVCHAVYQRLPNALEGELTKIKSAVVSRRICARVANKLRLTEPLILGQGMGDPDGLPRSLAAGVFEAFVGAMYIDGGLGPARRFILANMSAEIELAARSEHQFNFKSQLQQYSQRFLNAAPLYEVLDEKGPDHSKCFEVAVVVDRKQYGSAWGPSKKEAEQKAARAALLALGAIKPGALNEADIY
ncbi:MAG: ribonuclease III [Phycisphaerae bacterium]|nr:ribonuclease III [Phycisphaerae bacterium]